MLLRLIPSSSAPRLPLNRLIVAMYTLLLLFLALAAATASAHRPPGLGFVSRVEHPTLTVLESYAHLASSSSDQQHQQEYLRLRLNTHGQQFLVHLRPNHEQLFHPSARVNVYGRGGKLLSSQPLAQQPFRVFTGRVLHADHSQDIMRHGALSRYWAPFEESLETDRGWARIVVHDDDDGDAAPSPIPDLEGVISVDGQLYNIKTVDTYNQMRRDNDAVIDDDGKHPRRRLVVYRDSDFVETGPDGGLPTDATRNASACGHDHTQFNTHDAHKLYESLRVQHQDRRSRFGLFQKRAEAGCPTALKMLYIGVAADCTYVSNYQGPSNTIKQIVSNLNQASKLYEKTFNIALGIANVDIQAECGQSLRWNQECNSQYSINNRLNDFSEWRGTQKDTLGHWHLMTRCSSGVTVGISWLNMICQRDAIRQGRDVVSGTGVSSVNPNEWLVVAHEIGHSFGAIHDCTSSDCKAGAGSNDCCSCEGCDCKGQYVMHPTSEITGGQFSPCSVRNICQKSAVLASCLEDPGARSTITGAQCGNGVKEPGEECDCGPEDGEDCRQSECCQPGKCKLKPSARCDDKNDACCVGCQPKPASTVCRPSRGDCDIEERCDGRSGVCPKDSFKPDLQACKAQDNVDGQCASGHCTNRDLQCRIRGSVAEITRECPGFKNDCSMTCQASQGGACLKVSGFYLDGTPCGFDGKCQAGRCSQSFISSIIGWAQSNVILAAVIGLMVLMILFSLCSRLCSMTCARKRVPPPTSSVVLTTPPPRSFVGTPASSAYQTDIYQMYAVPPSARQSAAASMRGGPRSPPAYSSPPAQAAARSSPAAVRSWVDPAPYNGATAEYYQRTMSMPVSPVSPVAASRPR